MRTAMLLPQRELGARDSALAWSWSRDGSGGSAPPGSERLAIPVPHQRRSPALCAFPPAPGAPHPLSRLTWHPRRGHQSPPSGRRSEASPGWRDGRSRAPRAAPAPPTAPSARSRCALGSAQWPASPSPTFVASAGQQLPLWGPLDILEDGLAGNRPKGVSVEGQKQPGRRVPALGWMAAVLF